MPDSFGARLRRRREEQHIALTTIAGQTKIKLSLLEGLERDDVSHWPSGLYRRSFMRAYAHAIGLDPDAVVREFLEVHPDPAEVIDAAAAIAAAIEGDRTQGGAPNRLRSLVGSAFSRIRRSAASEAEAPAGPPVPNEPESSVEDFFADDDWGADGALADVLATPESDLGVVTDSIPDSPPVEQNGEIVVQAAGGSVPAVEQSPFEPDLSAVARLCTQFCRVENPGEVNPLLQEGARILGAVGVIVWIWDETAEELRPALAHGYSDRMLAQLPAVTRDADNATAAAFRTAHIRAINGTERSSGALVLPLITPGGCAGVLAIELPDGREQAKSVRAIATIVAALLAQLLGGVRPVETHAETPAADEAHERGPSYRRATLTH